MTNKARLAGSRAAGSNPLGVEIQYISNHGPAPEVWYPIQKMS